MFVVNGKFLSRNLNGQIRVAIETIKELDKIVPSDYVEIVAPPSEYAIDGLNNIEIKRIGKGNPHIWEQTYFAYYLKKNNGIGINFLNTHPIFKPDISYVHDVLFDAYPNLYKSSYGKLQKKYISLMIRSAVKYSEKIIVVSEFTKNEVNKYHPGANSKIVVIHNAWQQVEDIIEDEGIFDKFPQIHKNAYYMAASGITPQKNFKWIVENSKMNLDAMYVIVGPKENSTQENTNNATNLIYTNRVTDGEMKALMHYCRAFIHPAIYEGFGLTPMEAIASGCTNIILARASCLPEIYGDSVHYIDPNNPSVKIESLLEEPCRNPAEILKKYSWKAAANKLKKVMQQVIDKTI